MVHLPISEDVIGDFCRRNHIRTLSIFGSAVRKNFGPGSDVDVLVEFEPNAQVGFMALGRMQRDLSALLQRPVDLVPRAGLKPAIRQTILTAAEDIYAA